MALELEKRLKKEIIGGGDVQGKKETRKSFDCPIM
jgi:hypothetical protein